jgi:hypothetical protein
VPDARTDAEHPIVVYVNVVAGPATIVNGSQKDDDKRQSTRMEGKNVPKPLAKTAKK